MADKRSLALWMYGREKNQLRRSIASDAERLAKLAAEVVAEANEAEHDPVSVNSRTKQVTQQAIDLLQITTQYKALSEAAYLAEEPPAVSASEGEGK